MIGCLVQQISLEQLGWGAMVGVVVTRKAELFLTTLSIGWGAQWNFNGSNNPTVSERHWLQSRGSMIGSGTRCSRKLYTLADTTLRTHHGNLGTKQQASSESNAAALISIKFRQKFVRDFS